MAHSSSSASKKTQTVKYRATFQTEEIELVAKISRNHQQKIELSINNLQKKRRNITQGFTFFLVLGFTVFLVVLGFTVLLVLVLLVTDFWEYIA
ncbi:hypothetical protein AHAS_Ahas14G0180200 [Arachis hypogaea]